MNYYWWKAEDGRVGNVYAKSFEEATSKVNQGFGLKVSELKLLEENAQINRFKGEKFKQTRRQHT